MSEELKDIACCEPEEPMDHNEEHEHCCHEEHHHDHEHHHHDDEHEHHHHHHHHDADEKVEISTHEDAVIATVRMSLGLGRKPAEVMLKSFMTAVAEEVEGLGGTIGHIKFFFKESQGEMLSMTDVDEIQVKPAQNPEFTAEGVAIVVGLEPEQLERIVLNHYPA